LIRPFLPGENGRRRKGGRSEEKQSLSLLINKHRRGEEKIRSGRSGKREKKIDDQFR